MTEEWSIRAYSLSDRDELFRFFEEVFGELGREFLPEGKDSDLGRIGTDYLGNRGSFHIVEVGGNLQGTVGVRNFSADIAELKRLYLRENLRGKGIGHALCLHAIRAATDLGYQFLRLDTTFRSTAAIHLFTKLGFYQIPRYNADPYAEIFMEKDLGALVTRSSPLADGS